MVVIYNGIAPELLQELEFLGLDYHVYLKYLIVNIVNGYNSTKLMRGWYTRLESMYKNTDTYNVLFKIAKQLEYVLYPIRINGIVVKCNILDMSVSKLEVRYVYW